MKILKLFPVVLILAVAGACTQRAAVLPNGTSVVEGEVVYSGLGAVPPGDVVEVMLVNISDPEIVHAVATDRIDDPGDGPVSFDVVYQVQGVQAGNAYALCARALDASGDMIWHSAEPEPVELPTGEPVTVVVSADPDTWDVCAPWDDR